jgi:hypothetical protein
MPGFTGHNARVGLPATMRTTKGEATRRDCLKKVSPERSMIKCFMASKGREKVEAIPKAFYKRQL